MPVTKHCDTWPPRAIPVDGNCDSWGPFNADGHCKMWRTYSRHCKCIGSNCTHIHMLAEERVVLMAAPKDSWGRSWSMPACRAPGRKRRSCPSPAECEVGPIGRQVHTQTHARRGKAGGTHGRSTQILTRHHLHISASAHRCLNDPCARSHGLTACHHAQTAARCPGKRGGATRNQNCSASNINTIGKTSFCTGGPPAGLSIRKPSNCLVGALCRSQGQCFLGLMHHAGHQAL